MTVEKKDWEKVKEQFDAMLVNNLVNAEINQIVLDYSKKKISEFTDDKSDPMPEGVKEVVAGVNP